MLYSIIRQLQETSSTNEKLAIMEANKDNELLKEYMRLVTCPSVSFYITEKTFPTVSKTGTHTFQSLSAAGYSLGTKELSQRHVTGQAAKNFIVATMEDLDEEHQELYKMLLLKDIRAKIGVTLVNKVWPSLCVDIPYMRCSLPNEKNLKKFKEAETFIVQTKCDSSFATLVMNGSVTAPQLYTRNGNSYPKHIVDHLLEGSYKWENLRHGAKHALEGELMCFVDGTPLSRKVSNGILNSVMQGADIPENVTIKHVLWNYIPLQEWKSGACTLEYKYNLMSLYAEFEMCLSDDHFEIVDHLYVETLEEAYAFNQQQLAKGLEGSIIKTLTHKWKNGTSSECLKLKIEAEIDLEIISIEEASGKDKGCAGRVNAKSSCGKLVTGVNCNGEQGDRRKLFDQRHEYIGKIFTCLANDLVNNELVPDKMSLFLARSDVYNEIRTDKTEADSLERIEQIFEAIKLGAA